MKFSKLLKLGAWILCVSAPASAQREKEAEVPLMRPDERETVNEQSDAFNRALEVVIKDAAKSTVRVWGKVGRRGKPTLLAHGTVVGDGSQVLTKWSEVQSAVDTLYVQTGANEEFRAEPAGVFTEEDLVLLDIGGDVDFSSKEASGRPQIVPPPNDTEEASERGLGHSSRGLSEEADTAVGPGELSLVPAKFFEADLAYGRFLTAPQPSGRPGAFGVVSVLERNLRESDQAHLGVLADPDFRGKGVKIASVQPEYGAAEAGLQAGDIILAVGDRTISGLQELRNALTDKQPGDTIELLVEAVGKERSVEVLLSNRPVFGQFSGDRLNTMERMGGEPNRVRDGFSRVVQSDMQIRKNLVGGPVVDLQGRIVGITLARADRTRTYIMGSKAVIDLLKGDFDTVAEAKAKTELKRQELASQRRALIPKMRSQGKPRDLGRMERNLSDLERLLGRANEELEALESGQTP